MSLKVRYLPGADKKLSNDPGSARLLRAVADRIKGRVKVPKGYEVTTQSHVSRRGAFAQIVMRGPRAIFIEFGTKNDHSPLAPLRKAVFRGR